MNKMKKILIIVLFLLISTGCQVKYELNFTDNKLNENINIQINNSNEKDIYNLKEYKAYAIFDSTYQRLYDVEYQEGKTFNATYKYTYNYEEFKHAMYIKTCFDAFSFITNDNTYILSTSKGFKCMVLDYNKVDNVEIVINTNHEIIESNADRTKKNTLIWNVDDTNASEKKIYVKFGPVKELNFFEKNWLGIIILGSFIIVLLIVVISIVSISKKNNAID